MPFLAGPLSFRFLKKASSPTFFSLSLFGRKNERSGMTLARKEEEEKKKKRRRRLGRGYGRGFGAWLWSAAARCCYSHVGVRVLREEEKKREKKIRSRSERTTFALFLGGKRASSLLLLSHLRRKMMTM